MCRLLNIVMRDYQESVTTRQIDTKSERQIDAGQSDPHVPLCFAGDTKTVVDWKHLEKDVVHARH